jgi:hypothetical protein
MSVTLIPFSPTIADTEEELRISIGIRLFPSVLAADQRIANKQNNKGRLPLLIIYRSNQAAATAIAKKIQAESTVKGIPLEVGTLTPEGLSIIEQIPPGGIFLAENIGDELPLAIAFSQKNSTILFSPFPGDVERGVQCGISVRDRILPYINTQSLELADIQLKTFFIKVAEVYEQNN